MQSGAITKRKGQPAEKDGNDFFDIPDVRVCD